MGGDEDTPGFACEIKRIYIFGKVPRLIGLNNRNIAWISILCKCRNVRSTEIRKHDHDKIEYLNETYCVVWLCPVGPVKHKQSEPLWLR